MPDTTETTFPLDWNDWRRDWDAYKARKLAAGTFHRTSLRAPGKNFLADEILGTWAIHYADKSGRAFELSEVTMPDFTRGYGADRRRFVGITWVNADGTLDSGGVVESFADLDAALGA